MRETLERVLAVVGLAAIAGLSLGMLAGGLLTGAIDGPTRGRDVIEMVSRPIAFWLVAFFYLFLTVAPAVAAYKIARQRDAA